MAKIILFGLIKNIYMIFDHEIWKSVIAVADNDIEKQGKIINRIPIIHPRDISKVAFDKIIVLTWDYLSIKRQLLEYGIDPQMIEAVNKRLVTESVFSDRDIRAKSLSFVSEISNFFLAHDTPLFVEAGTLLGISRDRDLIHWDSDIDFSISECNYDSSSRILKKFSESFSEHYFIDEICSSDKVKQITGFLKFPEQRVPFDIFSRKNDSSGLSRSVSGDFFTCESRHFFKPCLIHINNMPFTVPCFHLEYLEQLYGPNWKIPMKDFSYSDFSYSRVRT
jgi:lipopolysaccharide cholinephosphotransferase